MSGEIATDTVPDLWPPRPEASSPYSPHSVDLGGRTHRGLVRKNNEDNFHIVQFGRYLRTLGSSLPVGDVPESIDQPGYGFAVADGIGGHVSGEVASRLAISLLIEYALQTPDWILGRDEQLLAKIMDRAAQRIRAVNEAVVAHGQGQEGLWRMGTTLSLALTMRDDLIVAHVGDSRVYLFRSGELLRLTRDHTVGQERADKNSPDADRFRHILTRAIGLPQTGGEPDVYRYKLADGDRLLLCTDGLTDLVDDETIARELARGTPSGTACESLVELALERGGKDNVTVVLATFRLPKQP